MLQTPVAQSLSLAEFCVQRREFCGFGSWEDFSEKTKFARATVTRILGNEPTRLGSRDRFAVALRLGDWAELTSRWAAGERADAIPVIESRGPPVERFGRDVHEFLNERTGPKPSRLLPEYSSVSAAAKGVTSSVPTRMTEVSASVKGDFIVTLDGQCMEPKFEDGDRVVVSRKMWEAEGFSSKQVYLVAFTNGQSTFKKVEFDEDAESYLWMVPLNENEDHKRWKVHRSEIKFAARVTATLHF